MRSVRPRTTEGRTLRIAVPGLVGLHGRWHNRSRGHPIVIKGVGARLNTADGHSREVLEERKGFRDGLGQVVGLEVADKHGLHTPNLSETNTSVVEGVKPCRCVVLFLCQWLLRVQDEVPATHRCGGVC